VAVNGMIMSVYLWHLTVMVAVIGASMAVGGVGLDIAPSSFGWWITRPIWIALLVALMVPVLALVNRFERPVLDNRPAPVAWRPVLAVVGTCGGFALLAKNGIADGNGVHGLIATTPIVAVVVGGVMRLPSLRSPQR
jgi:hypothetical protein